MSSLKNRIRNGLRENIFSHSTHSTYSPTFQIRRWFVRDKVLMDYYSFFSASQIGQTVSAESRWSKIVSKFFRPPLFPLLFSVLHISSPYPLLFAPSASSQPATRKEFPHSLKFPFWLLNFFLNGEGDLLIAYHPGGGSLPE